MKSFSKLISVIVFGFIVSAVLYVFLIRPNLSSVDELYTKSSAKQTELEALTAQISAYKNAKADLKAAASDKDKILNSVLVRENLQTVILEVEAAAANLGISEGMTIKEVLDENGRPITSPPIVSGKKTIDEVPYQIKVTAEFPSILKFIEYLEHLPHFSEISKFAFSTNSVAAGSTTDEDRLIIHTDVTTVVIDAVFMVQRSTLK